MFGKQNAKTFLTAVLLSVAILASVLLPGCQSTSQANTSVSSASSSSNPCESEEVPGTSAEPAGSGTTAPSSSVKIPTLPPEDCPPFVFCTEDDLHRGDLLLVNFSAPYGASLYDGEVTDIRSSRVTDIQAGSNDLLIEKSLLQTLEALQTDLQSAMKDKVCLLINDSYRSAEAQQAIIDDYLQHYGQAYVDKYVAPVGYSEHHTGLAVDLSFYDLSTGRILATTSREAAAHYAWFLENCHRYGLILRYPPGKEAVAGTAETWHFRYVGFPHAAYIASHDLVLEEYIEELKTTSYDRPLSIKTDDGKRYSVYYIPAAEGKTQVPVPVDRFYTVSGNNADGFIVTVEESSGFPAKKK